MKKILLTLLLAVSFNSNCGIANNLYLSKATQLPRVCKQDLNLVLDVLLDISKNSKPSYANQYSKCLNKFFEFFIDTTQNSSARQELRTALNELDRKSPNAQAVVLNLAYRYGVSSTKFEWGAYPVFDENAANNDPLLQGQFFCASTRSLKAYVKGMFRKDGTMKTDEELTLAAQNWLKKYEGTEDFVGRGDRFNNEVTFTKLKNGEMQCKQPKLQRTKRAQM
ncbi:MAG: hypothetical protein CMO49_01265 [Verrucomicrobiales bacterium]|nr:hypothetical protein [Verrucomicrobiales bacterium]|tara:strand:+ start:21802 stop:22470 length:669 start_codon:yes stop_codon:yes gene_type:complete